MIQLNIIYGKKAGSHQTVRHFPFSIGRQSGNMLQLDDDGIWEHHLTLEFKRRHGFFLTKAPDAVAAVNNQTFETVRLCNGDVITIGSARLQFWLASTSQRGLRMRETMIWTIIFAVTAFQLILIYVLIR